jgi:hypothetical protein
LKQDKEKGTTSTDNGLFAGIVSISPETKRKTNPRNFDQLPTGWSANSQNDPKKRLRIT